MVDFILGTLPFVSWPASAAAIAIAVIREIGKTVRHKSDEERDKEIEELRNTVNDLSVQAGIGKVFK